MNVLGIWLTNALASCLGKRISTMRDLGIWTSERLSVVMHPWQKRA
jgi:hypothetical protein